jgi:type I restriction enzyme S subunit
MSDELPQGWATTSLAELLTTLESGSRPRGGVRGIADGVPSVGGEHLNYNGGFNFESVKYVPKDFAAGMLRGRIQRNDILVVKDGATTGKTAFVDSRFPYDEAFVNEHVFICRSRKEIEPQFLFRFLTSMDGQKRILENFKGSAQGGINQTFAPNTEVPLAPFAEQQRIVAKLEKLLGQVDACQQRLVKLPTVLKRFRQSILAAACSGRLTADWREDVGVTGELPPNWSAKNLGEVATFSQGIQIGLEQHLTEPKPGYVRFLRIVNYTQNGGEFRFVPDPGPRYHVSPDEVVMVRYGEAGFVGRGFEGVLANNLFKIIPGQSLSRDYLYHLLKSPSVSQEIIQKRKGGSMPAISFDIVSELPVWIPPLAEQQEIVRRVAGLFALANQLEQRLAQARGQVAKLTPSLLARAFAGQLVPQNPEDEPAGKLLERIRPGGKP